MLMTGVGCYQRIHCIAQHDGNRTIGLNKHIELIHHPTVLDLDGSDLHHIIFKDVQSCGLCIKDHELPLSIVFQELIQIGRVGILQEIRG